MKEKLKAESIATGVTAARVGKLARYLPDRRVKQKTDKYQQIP